MLQWLKLEYGMTWSWTKRVKDLFFSLSGLSDICEPRMMAKRDCTSKLFCWQKKKKKGLINDYANENIVDI